MNNNSSAVCAPDLREYRFLILLRRHEKYYHRDSSRPNEIIIFAATQQEVIYRETFWEVTTDSLF